ncbi:MAG: hypothetical protein ACKE8R_08970 [Methylophagaceae bacterium]
MPSELDKLIELLSIVIEENLDCDIAEGLCNEIDWSKIIEIKNVYPNLFHYWNDQDHRQECSEYKAMQDSELKKLIQHLKKKEFVKACHISFLSVTPNS